MLQSTGWKGSDGTCPTEQQKQLEEFNKGQKRDTACPISSQNPSHWHPAWLSKACSTRKDSESEGLAKENLENDPITMNLRAT